MGIVQLDIHKVIKMEKKKCIVFLMFAAFAVMLAPQALALQVTAFSCNGESGTANVPNNLAFTCTATVNNPDSSTASLSSAKLYIDGSWAAQSYDGSGFSTSLATGASTTAVFADVTATTPGSHKFSYVLLDGVSDTFVTDAVVNVMDIRISRVRANATTAGNNEPITVIADVSAGGAMSITIAIDVSGCTLATGEQASKSVGSLSQGAQTSVSWKVMMGSSDCSYTVSVTGTGSGKVTDDVSGSVQSTSDGSSSPTQTTSGSGGGGGGGGGGGASLTSESALLESIPAGSIGSFQFKKFKDFAVYEVSLRANVNLESPKLTAKESRLPVDIASPADGASSAVYKYFSIIREKIANDQISEVIVRFKVPNDWLLDESVAPESVTLHKLAGSEWLTRSTKLTSREGGYALYESSIEGLSTFSIVGKKAAGKAAGAKQEEKAPSEEKSVPLPEQPEAGTEKKQQEPEPSAIGSILEKIGGLGPASNAVKFFVFAIGGILALIEAMHLMHRKLPSLNLRLPKVPPPPIIGQDKKK